MFGLGIWELIIILSIVVILFGAKRLPMIGDGVGKMISNFKKSSTVEELENPQSKEDPQKTLSANEQNSSQA